MKYFLYILSNSEPFFLCSIHRFNSFSSLDEFFLITHAILSEAPTSSRILS